MIIVVICLSYLLIMTTIALVCIGIDDLSKEEWLPIFMFIYLFPIWFVIFTAGKIRRWNVNRKWRKQRRKENVIK